MDYSESIMLFLEFCIFLTLFFQISASRIYTGSVFFLAMTFHELLFSSSDGIMYYGSASLFYLGVMVLTIPCIRVTKLVLNIHKICLLSIIINGFGWAFWYVYLPPNLYDLASMILHVSVIWAMMKNTKEKDNGFGTDWRTMFFGFNYNQGYKHILQHKGKART